MATLSYAVCNQLTSILDMKRSLQTGALRLEGIWKFSPNMTTHAIEAQGCPSYVLGVSLRPSSHKAERTDWSFDEVDRAAFRQYIFNGSFAVRYQVEGRWVLGDLE